MKAVWRGRVLAESNDTVVIEGNHYFPPQSVEPTFLRANRRHSLCYWKGLASYYDAVDGGMKEKSIAWFYPRPTWLARKIAGRDFSGHVAFGSAVEIT